MHKRNRYDKMQKMCNVNVVVVLDKNCAVTDDDVKEKKKKKRESGKEWKSTITILVERPNKIGFFFEKEKKRL